MFQCAWEMKWQRWEGSMWSRNCSRSMFQDPVVSEKAGAGKDGYFVTITSFLHPLPDSEELSCTLFLSCIPSHLSSLVYFTSPLVGFCFIFFSPELVNIHKCACKVWDIMPVSVGFSLLTSYILDQLWANMDLGAQRPRALSGGQKEELQYSVPIATFQSDLEMQK